jgi:hypothetical protein
MKSFLIIRSIFRTIGLISLLFRLFFVQKFSYNWNVFSYVFLAIGLAGMIVMEIIMYWYKRRKTK